MFRGTPPNPYDDLIVKATDETQTSENWSVLIEVCDKVVSDTSPTGPRDCILGLQKRLQHRSANVQLYCMTLAEALVKNCGDKVQREVASRSFMKALAAVVQDRNVHDKVKKRVLQCLESWKQEFEGNANLGLVEETVEELKSKGYRHEEEPEPPTHPSDDVLKREEEELQRALAESEREAKWMNLARAEDPSAGPSRIGPGGYIPAAGGQQRVTDIGLGHDTGAGSGKAFSTDPQSQFQHQPQLQQAVQPPVSAFARVSLNDGPVSDDVSLHPPGGATLYPIRTTSRPAPLRVRALFDFEPNEEGELGFKEGDVIKVVDSAYKDWWKGEARGITGIFPVNYVEPIPDPTPESLSREAEAEAAVFAQAGEIDRLLAMMQGLDARRDNLAENDELSELYQHTLSLRPKIVRLIEKYTQKKTELLQMNERFMKAKKTYDLMIEESLAKYQPGVAAETYTLPDPRYQPPQWGHGHEPYPHQQFYPQLGYGGYEQHLQYAHQPQQPYPPTTGPPLSNGPPPQPQGQQQQQQLPPYGPPPQPQDQQQQQQLPAYGPPPNPADVPVPEGIDTSKYYLASDGNWYAYTSEQLVVNSQTQYGQAQGHQQPQHPQGPPGQPQGGAATPPLHVQSPSSTEGQDDQRQSGLHPAAVAAAGGYGQSPYSQQQQQGGPLPQHGAQQWQGYRAQQPHDQHGQEQWAQPQQA